MNEEGGQRVITLRPAALAAVLAVVWLALAVVLGGGFVRHARAHPVRIASTGEALRRAVALDPSDAALHNQMANVSLGLLDFASAARSLRASLHANSHQPEIWLQYWFVEDTLGRAASAEAALARARELAPRSARVMLAGAQFFARRSEWDRSLDELKRAVRTDPRLLDEALEFCWEWAPDRSLIVERLLPPSSAAYERYLLFALRQGAFDEAARVWRHAAAHQPLSTAANLRYVDTLIAAGRPADALAVWNSMALPRRENNLIYNASLNERVRNAGFDWAVSTVPGVEVAYDRDGAGRSIALRFRGDGNPDYWNFRQIVPVQPGSLYRLQAWVRTEGITSSSTPRLEVQDTYGGQVLAASAPFARTAPWGRTAMEFHTASGTQLVTVGVRRNAAPPWDEPLSGTVWLRDFDMQLVSR